MKLPLINNYLQKFDILRSNSLKNVYELVNLRDEIYSIISSYTKKHKKEDVFTDILNHIALDINDEIKKLINNNQQNKRIFVL